MPDDDMESAPGTPTATFLAMSIMDVFKWRIGSEWGLVPHPETISAGHLQRGSKMSMRTYNRVIRNTGARVRSKDIAICRRRPGLTGRTQADLTASTGK